MLMTSLCWVVESYPGSLHETLEESYQAILPGSLMERLMRPVDTGKYRGPLMILESSGLLLKTFPVEEPFMLM